MILMDWLGFVTHVEKCTWCCEMYSLGALCTGISEKGIAPDILPLLSKQTFCLENVTHVPSEGTNRQGALKIACHLHRKSATEPSLTRQVPVKTLIQVVINQTKNVALEALSFGRLKDLMFIPLTQL